VRAVSPLDPALVDELLVRLVHERGGLQRVVASLGAERAGGPLAQFLVDERD
jgi:hypothetical protein